MHTVCRQGAHSGGSCIKDGGTQTPNKSVILEEIISDSNSKNSPTSQKTKNKETTFLFSLLFSGTWSQ